VSLARFDQSFLENGVSVLAGVDEAGRGPLAGPVTAAACIIPHDSEIDGINDSKQLTPQQRNRLFEVLTNNSQVVYGVGIVDVEVIDDINILQATIRAMTQALDVLATKPDLVLVDGMELSYPLLRCKKIIKGDARSLAIAAASIIAKETRDRIMIEYHQRWPEYGFDKHKGYGTVKHREAIHRWGPCPIHRRSFEPVKSLLA